MVASEAGATAREVYAFVAWTSITVCFGVFLCHTCLLRRWHELTPPPPHACG